MKNGNLQMTLPYYRKIPTNPIQHHKQRETSLSIREIMIFPETEQKLIDKTEALLRGSDKARYDQEVINSFIN